MATANGASGRGASVVEHHIGEVLRSLNLTTKNSRMEECPFCANTSRACVVYTDHLYCNACDTRATIAQVVAHELGLVEPDHDGRFPPLTPEQAGQVEAWFLERPNIEVAETSANPPVDPARLRERYVSEVTKVWAAANTVDGDRPTSGFLKRRGIDVAAVVSLDVARVRGGPHSWDQWTRVLG